MAVAPTVSKERIASDLRALADDIESGKKKVRYKMDHDISTDADRVPVHALEIIYY
jgi:hypothetical protein